ncbi:hypothetical protein Asi03nite_03480 [Actinoplanes siamensis]|uniref:Uncharacterized protein n=1 Tax=Actinoplanes siamensis TaxID=1223317 RepID=A0A919KAE7_9ACTN|nr:hypothetical protein Asi03nite_03480 [Actinoplanes siamensis]
MATALPTGTASAATTISHTTPRRRGGTPGRSGRRTDEDTPMRHLIGAAAARFSQSRAPAPAPGAR